MSKLFSFQGKIYLGNRNATTGKLEKPVWMGNAPVCQLRLTTDVAEMAESFSGNRLPYGRLQKAKKAELSLTLNEWLPETLALALYSSKIAIAGSTVTAEVMPTGLVAGDNVKLDKGFVSSLVITDSAGSPATVPNDGTKYSILSANSGLINWINVAAYVQPFKAAYTYAAASAFAMFSAAAPERYLLLDGINTEDNTAVMLRLYRVRFDPLGQLDLIGDDYGALDMAGSVLYDTINAADANLGGFGRIDQAA